MNKLTRKPKAIAAWLTASLALAAKVAPAKAADSVNVAFFLEWATPNQIARVDKVYDEAMGVDVNWTNFLTSVQMTEAMLGHACCGGNAGRHDRYRFYRECGAHSFRL